MDSIGAAVELLYERYLDTVFSYVLHRVPNRAEAEDITAETFVAALTAYPKFRHEGGEKAWLLGIARGKIAEAARRWERKQSREQLDADLSEQEREALGLLLTADLRQLPEDAALLRETRQMMRHLLDQLPELQRLALVLQVEDELSIREIAQLLGRTVAATNSLLQRARATLFRHGQAYFAD